MLEEFISVALEAFINANGDADKFELQLRRKLMVYNSSIPVANKTTQNSIISPQFEQVVNSFDVNDPIFNELENVDINSMSDEDIMALAQKMGLMIKSEENE